MNNEPYIYKSYNKNFNNKINVVIAIAGLQLARKAQGAFVAKERGYYVFSVGDHIRDICRSKGQTVSFKNIEQISSELLLSGNDAILREELPKIQLKLESFKGIVIDSVKSLEEIIYLKEHFEKLFTVGFLASYKFRREYSILRNREDEAKNTIEFDKRDEKEIKLGLANVLVFSDYFVLADTPISTQKQFHEILNKIEQSL